MFSKRIHRTELMEGDHVLVRRFGLVYSHHGIYMGQGRIIHYSEWGGFEKEMASRVVETSLDDFLRGGELRRRDHPRASARERILRRAKRLLSRGGYSLLWNNCEHFASYCATGRRRSPQVERFLVASASTAALLLGGVFLGGRTRARL